MKKVLSTLFVFVIAVNSFAAGHIVTASGVTTSACGEFPGTGSGTATVTGGIGPFGYTWIGPMAYINTNQNISNLWPGTFVVTAIDSSDMSTAYDTLVITGPSPLALSASSSNVTCFGVCDGNAIVIPFGGTPGYTYLWSPIGMTTNSVTGLCAGNYTVTITDANGCSINNIVVTGSPTPVVIAPIASSTICFGACATITAMPVGGNPPYSYTWSPAGTGSIASPTVCPSASTTYFVNVTDSNGCTASPVSTTITVNPPIILTTTATAATSCTSCNGTATVAPTGGSSPYTYLWITPFGQTTQTAVGLCGATTYPVTVVDSYGCTATDSVHVNNPHVACNYTMVPDSTNAYHFWGFNTSSGDSLSYIWYFGDGDSSFVQSPLHTYAATGTYNVCLIVSNPGGCFDVKCSTVNVTGILNSCMALFNIAQDTSTTDMNAHTVYNLSYGATLTYLWDFGDGGTSAVMNPTHVYASTGPFEICLTVDNGSGCTNTFCDSIMYVDSLSRAGEISLSVIDMPFPSTVGISENIPSNNSVSVFPNPFSENTTFEIQSTNLNEIYSFELIDVLGKNVKSISGITEKQFQISRNGLENGIYFYKIQSSKSLVGIGKLIIK